MLNFIMDHYIIVMIVIAFVLFAIIGFVVDTNKQTRQAQEEEADLAKEEAFVQVQEIVQPVVTPEPVVEATPVVKIAPDPSVDEALAEPKIAPDPSVDAVLTEAKVAPEPAATVPVTEPVVNEVKDNK